MKDIWTSKKHITEKKTRYIPYKVYSNCITEIPQNIKLTLENNTLYVEKGTILTLEGETYSTTTTTVRGSISLSGIEDGKYYIFTTPSGDYIYPFSSNHRVENIKSGRSLPETGSPYELFFNTTDKRYYQYTNGWQYYHDSTVLSYPLGILEVSNGVASFAKDSNGNDMIFNGAGFIGHHAFFIPQNQWLQSNGYDDGQLSSIERTNNSMIIIEMMSGNYNTLCYYTENSIVRRKYIGKYENFEDLPLTAQTNSLAYIINKNIMAKYDNVWYGQKGLNTIAVEYKYDGTTVTDFTIRQPYEGAVEQTLYNEEEYEVEYNRTFLNIGETDVFKAKNILQTQEGSLSYAPDLGIDLKRFLDPDIKIQNETFEAYSIQKLGEQGINTVNLISNEETFKEVFDYTVAETTKEGMVAK